MVIKLNVGTNQATTTKIGSVRFATTEEVTAGISTSTAVNPAGITSVVESLSGTIYDIILLSTGWVGTSAPYTYTINSITGVTSNSNLHTILDDSITLDQLKAFQSALIIDGGLSTDTIVYKALGAKPTVDIPIRIIVSKSLYVESSYEIDNLPIANTTTSGIIKIAEISDVTAGTDNTKAITPLLLLKNKANGVVGLDASLLINDSYIPTTIARLDSPTFTGTVTGTFNGNLTGNATTATSAGKLANARTLSLTGDVTGSGSFDGTGDLSITATVVDDGHNHIISNIDNLQNVLDTKAPIDSPTFTGTVTATTFAGNATTATTATSAGKLTNAITINGISFDGAGNVTIPPHSAISTSASGYIKLQSSGLIIQWGQLSGSGGDTYTCTFPIAFPTACLNVVGSCHGDYSNGGSYTYCNVRAWTKTQFTAKTNIEGYTSSGYTSWFAVGY